MAISHRHIALTVWPEYPHKDSCPPAQLAFLYPSRCASLWPAKQKDSDVPSSHAPPSSSSELPTANLARQALLVHRNPTGAPQLQSHVTQAMRGFFLKL